MAKQKGFVPNLIRGLKGFVTGLVAGIIMFVGVWLSRYLVQSEMTGVGVIIGLVVLLIYFVVWGWLANTFWKWK